MSIPVSNPKASYLAHKEEVDAAVTRVLDSGRYVGGEEVAAFEQAWADYVGVKHAVAVGSGTDALTLILRALEIGPGDEVIVPSWTCTATVAPIAMVGATPVFADVDRNTYTLMVGDVEERITERTKAILPVHLYGLLAEVDALCELADFHGVHLIEDACQAHGARDSGGKAGSFGIAAAFSHYPTKNLGALGDGGSITTNNGMLARRLRSLREYGWNNQRDAQYTTGQSRLDPVQAAVLRVKLPYLDQENARRRQIAAYYKTLTDWSTLDPFLAPRHPSWEGADHVFHQYVVDAPRRAEMRARLTEVGIQTAIHYPVAVHHQRAYRHDQKSYLHTTLALETSLLSVPMYPELTDAEVEQVGHALCNAAAWGGR